VLADELGLMGADARLVVAVGFLGGFTTWSTFMVGAVTLLRGGDSAATLVYLALSLLGGPLMVASAAAGTRALFARGGRRLGRQGLAAEMNSIEAEEREPLEGRR
jgi:CrcB protein